MMSPKGPLSLQTVEKFVRPAHRTASLRLSDTESIRSDCDGKNLFKRTGIEDPSKCMLKMMEGDLYYSSWLIPCLSLEEEQLSLRKAS
jgi:hypothetical protein